VTGKEAKEHQPNKPEDQTLISTQAPESIEFPQVE